MAVLSDDLTTLADMLASILARKAAYDLSKARKM
ncbi:hypothetical protein [Extibacter sp. GGCC_0201]